MRRALSGRRRLAAAGALAACAAAILAVAAGALPGDAGAPSRAATISTATTEIRRQDLVEQESEDGKLGHGDSRQVVNRLSGTVTWLPREGAVVRPGQRLFEVDGAPVVLMDGHVPAYRALTPSVSDGPDVAELERDLRALGYDAGGAIAVDDSWDAGTTAAVERWQEARGLSVTGSIELGRVIFQPGRRRIQSIAVTLGGSTQGGNGSSNGEGSSTGASSTEPAAPRTVFASYTPPKQEAPETNQGEDPTQRELRRKQRELERREAALRKREQALRQGEKQQQQQPNDGGGTSDRSASAAASASRDDSSSSAGGSAVASQVMTTTSTRPVVTVELDTSKEAIARARAAVTVDLPDGGRARGRISSVGKVATAESSDDANSDQPASDAATVKVTIRLARRIAALDDAPVTVNFERSRRRGVLAVPVTALLARSGGRFAVEVREGGRRRIVPVTPGLYASGYVEIEGRGLEAGMRVTDARV